MGLVAFGCIHGVQPYTDHAGLESNIRGVAIHNPDDHAGQQWIVRGTGGGAERQGEEQCEEQPTDHAHMVSGGRRESQRLHTKFVRLTHGFRANVGRCCGVESS